MKKILTLVLVHDSGQILLGMKKRGFGAGRWNGFGGKVQESETIEQAALRELQEEVGLSTSSLLPRGVITFTFNSDDKVLETHLFSTASFEGEPSESDEMRPQWFAHHEIPYHEMWSDDIHWLPLVLEGKNPEAAFHFDNPDDQNILRQTINVL